MRLTAAILAACAALALAACGGDDEQITLPSTTTATGATGSTGASGASGATGSGAAVETALTNAGFGISSVTCPDEVPLEEGDTFECDFTTEQGDSGTLSVSVDSADETSATLSYQSDSPQVQGEGVDVQK